MFALPSQTIYVQFIDPVTNQPVNLTGITNIVVSLVGKNYTNTLTSITITNAAKGQITALVSNIKPDIYDLTVTATPNTLAATIAGVQYTVEPVPDRNKSHGSNILVKNFQKHNTDTPVQLDLLINGAFVQTVTNSIGISASPTSDMKLQYTDAAGAHQITDFRPPVLGSTMTILDLVLTTINSTIDGTPLNYTFGQSDSVMELFIEDQRFEVY